MLDARWRVTLAAEIELPMDSTTAWELMRDFRTFACLDVFHRRVELDGPSPGAGVGFLLHHGLAGIELARVGRILRWDEGRGYAFSDLSRRGPGHGFPHVYTYELLPLGPGRSRFVLGVRGRWTARRLPRVVVRLWLTWILLKTRISLRNAFLAGALSRRTAAVARSANGEDGCRPVYPGCRSTAARRPGGATRSPCCVSTIRRSPATRTRCG